MRTAVIDYGMGNLGSVCRAFEECGSGVKLAADPSALQDADAVVLPGVGAFADGMRHLEKGGWVKAIRESVRRGTPLLGICLGMQLLAERGTEGGDVQGIGLIRGSVPKLRSEGGERIPHMGWNEVYPSANHPLFDGIPSGSDFYFVHSYHFSPAEAAHRAAVTPYCGEFVSAVGEGKVFGVQFHPEKSSKPGFRLIRNFLLQGRQA